MLLQIVTKILIKAFLRAFKKWKLEKKSRMTSRLSLYLMTLLNIIIATLRLLATQEFGKTQFALELLSQVSELSNGQVNFIYLDFKGLKQDDIKVMQPFFNATHAEFVDVPNNKFPVNPLTFIDNVNEVDRNIGHRQIC